MPKTATKTENSAESNDSIAYLTLASWKNCTSYKTPNYKVHFKPALINLLKKLLQENTLFTINKNLRKESKRQMKFQTERKWMCFEKFLAAFLIVFLYQRCFQLMRN